MQGGDDLPGRFNPAIFPAAAQALFFLFKTGLFDDQLLLGLAVAVLVNDAFNEKAGEPLELLLKWLERAVNLLNRCRERAALVLGLRVNEGQDVCGFLGRQRQWAKRVQALLGQMLLAQIWLGAGATGLPGGAIIAIQAAVALRPLRGDHRTTGAAKQAAERKVMPVAHFPGLAFDLEGLLDLRKEVGGNDGGVSTSTSKAFFNSNLDTTSREPPKVFAKMWAAVRTGRNLGG